MGRRDGECVFADGGDVWRDAAFVSRDLSVMRRETRRATGAGCDASASTATQVAERLVEVADRLVGLGYGAEAQRDRSNASRCTIALASDRATLRANRAWPSRRRGWRSAVRRAVAGCRADLWSAVVVLPGDRADGWAVSDDGLACRENEPAAGARVRADGREESPDGVGVSKRDETAVEMRLDGRCRRFVETTLSLNPPAGPICQGMVETRRPLRLAASARSVGYGRDAR